MKRPVIEIAGQRYRLTKTPQGENCCRMCVLQLYCFEYPDSMPCVELTSTPDWHFEHEKPIK